MPLDQHSFKSSAIVSGSYDADTQELVVVFTGGRSYSFDGVPPDVWERFKAAPSAGSFYNAMLRGQY